MAAHSGFLIVGVLVGVAVGVWRLHARGLNLSACLRLEVVLVLAGVLGAKGYSLWERGGGAVWVLDEWTRSYRHPGGIIAVVLVVVLCRRWLLRGVSLGTFADAVAPATGLAMAVARLGCFALGCCFGYETDVAWSVQFPAESPAWRAQVAAGRIHNDALMSLPVHPLQLYFAAASAAVALFTWWFERYATYAGQAALLFIAFDSLAKLGLETMRGDPEPHLQVVALAIVVGSSATLLMIAVLGYGRPSGFVGAPYTRSADG